jgi:hypothetical protein
MSRPPKSHAFHAATGELFFARWESGGKRVVAKRRRARSTTGDRFSFFGGRTGAIIVVVQACGLCFSITRVSVMLKHNLRVSAMLKHNLTHGSIS